MNREFIYTKLYHEAWAALCLGDDDQREMEMFLLEHPDTGDMMQNTGGLRKMRWSFRKKGKRGGIRVLYVDFQAQGVILMVLAYPKGKKDTITHNEVFMIKNMIMSFCVSCKEIENEQA